MQKKKRKKESKKKKEKSRYKKVYVGLLKVQNKTKDKKSIFFFNI